MWIIVKCKNNEQNLFEKNINQKMFEKVKIFNPKIKLNFFKNNKLIVKTKPLLNNYLFCYHKKFSDTKILRCISNTKGLMYLLQGSNLYQNEIEHFIKYCKYNEDENGYIKQNFLEISHDKLYKFISGPFTNMFFDIIEKQKNKLRIMVGNIVTTVPYNKNYLYRPVWYKSKPDESIG